ncbi:BCOR [Symbiodinium sp. CCMP2592]|nr:BCOR [Symbiodinium sp. CCMP2592]
MANGQPVSPEPVEDEAAFLRAEASAPRQANCKSRDEVDEHPQPLTEAGAAADPGSLGIRPEQLKGLYDEIHSVLEQARTSSATPETKEVTPAEKEFEFMYKDETFQSTSLLHQYCAMEGLNAGQLSAVDELLAGMRPDADDWWAIAGQKKVHALHVATAYGHAVLAQRLLDAAADVNVQEIDGEKKRSTALHYAVLYDRRRVMKVLLERGADPSILLNGFTALHSAARLGNAEAVEGILVNARQQKLFEGQNEDWKTTTLDFIRPAIQLACEAGDSTCFRLLLAAMEDESSGGFPDYWNSVRSYESQCFLVNFAFGQRPKIASLLLELYQDMAVVRRLLKGREVEIITQMLRNPADWKTVLDIFVKSPEQMLAFDRASYFDKCNCRLFWKQNFSNHLGNGMAWMRGYVRSVRYARSVLDFAGNRARADPGSDFRKKEELWELWDKLIGVDGLALEQKRFGIGVIPIDANLLASDEILLAICGADYSLLDTKFVQAILDDSWAEVKVWYYWHVFWAFLQVAMSCVVSASLRDASRPGGQLPAAAFIPLSVAWFKRLIEELFQLVVYWCYECTRLITRLCPPEPPEPEPGSKKPGPPRRRCLDSKFSCLFNSSSRLCDARFTPSWTGHISWSAARPCTSSQNSCGRLMGHAKRG